MSKTDSVVNRAEYVATLKADLDTALALNHLDRVQFLLDLLSNVAEADRKAQEALAGAVVALNTSHMIPMGWSLESDLTLAKGLITAVKHNLAELERLVAEIESR